MSLIEKLATWLKSVSIQRQENVTAPILEDTTQKIENKKSFRIRIDVGSFKLQSNYTRLNVIDDTCLQSSDNLSLMETFRKAKLPLETFLPRICITLKQTFIQNWIKCSWHFHVKLMS